jgi:hypothetical protein
MPLIIIQHHYSTGVPCAGDVLKASVRTEVREIFIDGCELEDGALLHCDVVIVGAGPAGLMVAERLGVEAERRRRESGQYARVIALFAKPTAMVPYRAKGQVSRQRESSGEDNRFSS